MSSDLSKTIDEVYGKVFFSPLEYKTNSSVSKLIFKMLQSPAMNESTPLNDVLNFLITKTNISLSVLPAIYKSEDTGENKKTRLISDSNVNLNSEDDSEDLNYGKVETVFMKSFKLLKC